MKKIFTLMLFLGFNTAFCQKNLTMNDFLSLMVKNYPQTKIFLEQKGFKLVEMTDKGLFTWKNSQQDVIEIERYNYKVSNSGGKITYYFNSIDTNADYTVYCSNLSYSNKYNGHVPCVNVSIGNENYVLIPNYSKIKGLKYSLGIE